MRFDLLFNQCIGENHAVFDLIVYFVYKTDLFAKEMFTSVTIVWKNNYTAWL